MEVEVWEGLGQLHMAEAERAEIRWKKTGNEFFQRQMKLELMIGRECYRFAGEAKAQYIHPLSGERPA